MKTHSLFILLICSAIWSPALTADDYPEGYIVRQLKSAKKPIEVNISSLKPGQLMAIEYVDMPVWIYRRTTKDIEYLSKNDNSILADPKSENLISSIEAAYGSSASYVWGRLLLVDQPAIEKKPYRSLKEEIFVVGGWSPHSGCVLTYHSPNNSKSSNAAFYDPCTGATFDVAGRIVKGILTGKGAGNPASYNLYIPPYKFKNDAALLVGLTEPKELPEINVPKERRYLGNTPTEKLITACRYNDLETVKLALKEGANASYYAAGKGSPLDAAIIGSSIKVIELLIANGAKPTPNSLNAANFVGRAEVVKLIKGMR
jgi:ubiquinol-cytochrome c reductase iron-sulfur subunit